MAEESRSIIETEEEIAPGARLAEQAADLVCIEGVTKSFGYKTAVKEVSFQCRRGKYAVCWAGMTTLFRLLVGILKATEGSLKIDSGNDGAVFDALAAC